MIPYLFTSVSFPKSKFRDYIIDLNKEHNLEEIINILADQFKKYAENPKSNKNRILSYCQDIFGKEELKKMIAYHLVQLDINFSHVEKDMFSGQQSDAEPSGGICSGCIDPPSGGAEGKGSDQLPEGSVKDGVKETESNIEKHNSDLQEALDNADGTK